MVARPFVVLFLGRSGSTYLVEALASHPDVEAGFEELASRHDLGAAGQLEFARAFLTAPRDRAGAVGFKTKLRDVLDREGFATLLRELDAHVISLQRRNVVKAVVSWFRSEAVNSATGDWNVYDDRDRPPAVTPDPAEFAGRVAAYEAARKELQLFTLGLERPTLMLYYEDLLADPGSVLDAACGFLRVERMSLQGHAVKATPDDLRLAVTNIEELKAALDPRYGPMFDHAASGG